MQATAIILAAGLGTRMKSSLPKTLHRLAGRSMLRHLLASCETVFDRIVVVLGPDMDAVRKEAEPHVCVVQQERLGTAHAALQAVEHFGDGQVAVLYADNPLIRPATLRRLLEQPYAARSVAAGVPSRRPGPLRAGDHRRGRHGRAHRRVCRRLGGGTRGRPVQCRRAVRRRRPTCARWLQAVRNDNAKARILSHRRRRPGPRRRAAGLGGGGAGGRTGRGQLARRTGAGRGGAAGLDAGRGDGGGGDDDRSVLGLPVRRYAAVARRHDRAERVLRAGRHGRQQRRRSAHSAISRAPTSVRAASSARSPGCAPAPSSTTTCTSAISWRSRPPTWRPG